MKINQSEILRILELTIRTRSKEIAERIAKKAGEELREALIADAIQAISVVTTMDAYSQDLIVNIVANEYK